MPELLFADILRWTGGTAAGPKKAEPGLILRGVSSDSRSISRGGLFIALHGERHDGHQFLDQAVESGAAALLVDRATALESLSGGPAIPVILVSDTLQALQRIAAGYRGTLPGKVVGITGSVGKTSTRQMISACLACCLATHQARANLNNEIGLPQTLLLAENSHQAIVLEMGMRGPGEIRLLTQIARPDIAVITTIGTSHIGRLGSREAILAAKAEIVEGLPPDGLLILNADDPYLRQLGQTLAASRRLAWICASGSLQAGEVGVWDQAAFIIKASAVEVTAEGTSFEASLAVDGKLSPVETTPVRLPFPGEHHIQNTLFGLAVAHELGINLTRAASGAASCQITGNRQRILQAGSITIMDDSYNASPESMQAALKTLSALAGPGRRKIAALGGMLELGEFAESAHFEVGVQAARQGLARILAVGPFGAAIAEGARSIQPELPVSLFDDAASLAASLLPILQPGDCLLVKGSRGFTMETVTEAILQELGPPAQTPAENHLRRGDQG